MASVTRIDEMLPFEPTCSSIGALLEDLDDDDGEDADEEATVSDDAVEGIASELEPDLHPQFQPSFASLVPRPSQPRFKDSQGVPLVAPPLPHQDVLEPGGYVGKYQLIERLGQGAFGLVFLAYDTELDREVAMKILNPTHLTNTDVLHRFLQEARTTARISHPGIVTVLDCGQVQTTAGDLTAFIAMELLQGESLTDRLARRRGRLAAREAIEIVRQMASALDAAHRAEVLHRDLKPDNIYLVPDPAIPCGERVKVFDFGLAKLGRVGQTQVESIFGTPRYMSPEQWRSAAQIDARSDIYALGCILYELITGETPFVGKLKELFELHTRMPAPRARASAPDCPAALDDLIAAMLAKDPAARPQSMDAVAHALHAIGSMLAAGLEASALGNHLAPLARPPTAPPQLPDGTHAHASYPEREHARALDVVERWTWKPAAIAFAIATLVAGTIQWM